MKDQIPSTQLNADTIITYDLAIMVHEVLREKCAEQNSDLKIQNSENERSSNIKATVEDLKTLSYIGAKVWNELPNEIRNAESAHLSRKK